MGPRHGGNQIRPENIKKKKLMRKDIYERALRKKPFRELRGGEGAGLSRKTSTAKKVQKENQRDKISRKKRPSYLAERGKKKDTPGGENRHRRNGSRRCQPRVMKTHLPG